MKFTPPKSLQDLVPHQFTAHRLFSLCLLSHILVQVMVSVLFKRAVCIDLACFCQLPCAKYVLFAIFI